MGNVVQNVTATTASDELQVRNGQEHQRVFDPSNQNLLINILQELKKINEHLSLITENE